MLHTWRNLEHLRVQNIYDLHVHVVAELRAYQYTSALLLLHHYHYCTATTTITTTTTIATDTISTTTDVAATSFSTFVVDFAPSSFIL